MRRALSAMLFALIALLCSASPTHADAAHVVGDPTHNYNAPCIPAMHAGTTYDRGPQFAGDSVRLLRVGHDESIGDSAWSAGTAGAPNHDNDTTTMSAASGCSAQDAPAAAKQTKGKAPGDSTSLMRSGRAAKTTPQVLKGPIADAVPKNLPQQMALDAAKQGYGRQIMGPMKDAPRLVANYGEGDWVKMQYVLRGEQLQRHRALLPQSRQRHGCGVQVPMIVRCIANLGSAVPEANIDPRRGYDRSTEFPLTVGRDYTVFALTVFLGTAWYYVLDDDGHDWPTWSPSALFDVVDGAIPPSWVVGYFRASTEDQHPLISFPEWAGDHTFYERLVDGDPAVVETFARRRREVDGGAR